ncbi:MAG: pilin [bacterium]|nr:pilin [bacterium]
MKKLSFMILSATVLAMFLAAPASIAFAQKVDRPEDPGFQLIPCDGVKKQKLDASGQPMFETVMGTDSSGKPVSTTRPVYVEGSEACEYKHVLILANRIVNFLLYLAIPLALGMIMWIAFTYLTANGDSGKVAKAKSMLMPFIIGLFWILAAFVVVKAFLGYFLADNIGGSQSSESFINKFLGN